MAVTTKVVEVFHVSDEVRASLGEAADILMVQMSTTGEVIQNTADLMTQTFGGQWYSTENKQIKAAVKELRMAFCQRFDDAGKSKGVGGVYWGRVKAAAGHVPKAGSSATLTIDAQTLRELKTTLARILNAEDDTEGMALAQGCKHLLIECFEHLGGDVTQI